MRKTEKRRLKNNQSSVFRSTDRMNLLQEVVLRKRDAESHILTFSYDFKGRLIGRVDRGAGGTCASPSGTIEANLSWAYDQRSANDVVNGWGKLV